MNQLLEINYSNTALLAIAVKAFFSLSSIYKSKKNMF